MVNGKFVNNSLQIVVIVLILSLVISMENLSDDAHANHSLSIEWHLGGNPPVGGLIPINEGGIDAGTIVSVVVHDPALDNGIPGEEIDVTISSSVGDSTLLRLVETSPGVFENTGSVVFMTGNHRFSVSDVVRVQLQDNCDPLGPSGGTTGNCDSNVIETLVSDNLALFDGVYVQSDSDTFPGGIGLTLTETGPDTGIFETTLKFSNVASSQATGTILVSDGDRIVVQDDQTFDVTNGIIIPSISSGNAGIRSEIGGTVTVAYKTVSDVITSTNDGAPGRGGGGLVRPGLVVDSSGSGGGFGAGCDKDCFYPTLGIGKDQKRYVKDGFSYNGNPTDVEQFFTPYPLITVKVGEENLAILRIYENYGPQNVEHVGLAFGMGHGEFFSDSRAIIEIDWTRDGKQTVSKFDPKNTIEINKVTTEYGDCGPSIIQECLVVMIYHTFRAPLEFNMVGTNVWDFERNGWQNYFNHGIHIEGDSLNPPEQHIGIHKGKITHLIETGKNQAVDEFGNEWIFDKEWKMVFVPKGKIITPITSHGYDRNHVYFEDYKKDQVQKAKMIFEKLTTGKLDKNDNSSETFSHNFDYKTRSDDAELQKRILDEISKAEQIRDNILGFDY